MDFQCQDRGFGQPDYCIEFYRAEITWLDKVAGFTTGNVLRASGAVKDPTPQFDTIHGDLTVTDTVSFIDVRHRNLKTLTRIGAQVVRDDAQRVRRQTQNCVARGGAQIIDDIVLRSTNTGEVFCFDLDWIRRHFKCGHINDDRCCRN